jgi:hypothetical protein
MEMMIRFLLCAMLFLVSTVSSASLRRPAPDHEWERVIRSLYEPENAQAQKEFFTLLQERMEHYQTIFGAPDSD